MLARFGWLMLCGLTAGCLPIPWHRTVMVRPEGVVRVIDQDSRAPIAGAWVVVRRYNIGPPPRRVTDRFAALTSKAGEARFTAAVRGEWVFPLMMHGVPQWAVEVCASADGHAPIVTTWVVQRAWSTPSLDTASVPRVELALEPAAEGGQSGCDLEDRQVIFGRTSHNTRLSFAAPPPERPDTVPPSARWTWASETWIDCRPRAGAPGRFDCEVFADSGVLVVTGAFVMQARHGDPAAPPVPYAFELGGPTVVLEDDRALIADGWVSLPQISERKYYDHGALAAPP